VEKLSIIEYRDHLEQLFNNVALNQGMGKFRTTTDDEEVDQLEQHIKTWKEKGILK